MDELEAARKAMAEGQQRMEIANADDAHKRHTEARDKILAIPIEQIKNESIQVKFSNFFLPNITDFFYYYNYSFSYKLSIFLIKSCKNFLNLYSILAPPSLFFSKIRCIQSLGYS